MTQRHSPLYSARFEPRRIAQMALRGQLDIGFEPEVLLKLGWQAPDHLEFRGKPAIEAMQKQIGHGNIWKSYGNNHRSILISSTFMGYLPW